MWDLVGVGSIEREGDDEGGEAKEVSLGEPLDNYVLAAVRQGNDLLKRIAYRVTPTGGIVRVDECVAGEFTLLDMATTRDIDRKSVTAVRDRHGNLELIVWDIALSSYGVATIAHHAERVVEPVSSLSISRSADTSGNIRRRRSTRVAGSVTSVRLLTAPLGDSNLTSVVRGADGRIYLIGWAVDDNGHRLRRLPSSRAGTASMISADVVPRSYRGLDPRDMILTPMKDTNGRLKVIAWDTNLVNP